MSGISTPYAEEHDFDDQGADFDDPDLESIDDAEAPVPDVTLRAIKRAIWLYFLLLIFEGAIRKWILPSLATPLLVVRDPIAVYIFLQAIKHRMMPTNGYVIGGIVIGLLSMVTAVIFGHGHLIVAAYGGRTLILHLPVAFVIGRVFDHEDVIRIGKAMLWITIPMVVLMGLQFYSPQSAWVNRGVGGDMDGAGFDGAMGFARPPGTFSFTNGLTLFLALASPFIFYFWLEPWRVDRRLLWVATAALVFSIPLSISRSLVFNVALAGMFSCMVLVRQPRYAGRAIVAIVGITLALAIASQIPAFQTATEVLSTRFENASRSEGGLEGTLGDRLIGGMLRAITNSFNVDILGKGIGLGTNVGAKYTTGGFEFLIAEGEWPRTIGELGAIMGLSVIMLRVTLASQCMLRSIRELSRGDCLPWMLVSTGFMTMIAGGWAQPTALGFFTLTTGLLVAAFNHRESRSYGSNDVEDGLVQD